MILALLYAWITLAGEITIGSYNVENLFDATHDEEHEDWAYLPKSSPLKSNCKKVTNPRRRDECFNTDWTNGKIAQKIEMVAKILSERGYPTILGIVEIENENVLKQLEKRLGYTGHAITTGEDKRGINVALLYKEDSGLKFYQENEYPVDGEFFQNKQTRNILEVLFKTSNGSTLGVYVNHWPSQGSPTVARIQAAEKLQSVVSDRIKREKDFHAVAMGDFNTIDQDYPSPFKAVTSLIDFSAEFDVQKSNTGVVGTYYYRPDRAWRMLDRFFISPTLRDRKGLEVVSNSLEIHAPQYVLNKIRSGGDHSIPDHLPIFMKLTY